MRNLPRKVFVAAAATLIVAGGAGTAAFAFWSNAGSGTATIFVAASADITAAPVVKQTSPVVGLSPGSAAQPLFGNFSNNATGAQTVQVNSVTASVTSISRDGLTLTTCTAADFIITNPTMRVNTLVPVGSSVGTWSGATIAFNSTAADQNACRNAIVNISYVAN